MSIAKMTTCCIDNCGSTEKDYRLLSLPPSRQLQRLWLWFTRPHVSTHLNQLDLNDFYVCEKHFERCFNLKNVPEGYLYYPSLFTDTEILHGVPSIRPSDIKDKIEQYSSRESDGNFTASSVEYIYPEEDLSMYGSNNIGDHDYHICQSLINRKFDHNYVKIKSQNSDHNYVKYIKEAKSNDNLNVEIVNEKANTKIIHKRNNSNNSDNGILNLMPQIENDYDMTPPEFQNNVIQIDDHGYHKQFSHRNDCHMAENLCKLNSNTQEFHWSGNMSPLLYENNNTSYECDDLKHYQNQGKDQILPESSICAIKTNSNIESGTVREAAESNQIQKLCKVKNISLLKIPVKQWQKVKEIVGMPNFARTQLKISPKKLHQLKSFSNVQLKPINENSKVKQDLKGPVITMFDDSSQSCIKENMRIESLDMDTSILDKIMPTNAEMENMMTSFTKKTDKNLYKTSKQSKIFKKDPIIVKQKKYTSKTIESEKTPTVINNSFDKLNETLMVVNKYAKELENEQFILQNQITQLRNCNPSNEILLDQIEKYKLEVLSLRCKLEMKSTPGMEFHKASTINDYTKNMTPAGRLFTQMQSRCSNCCGKQKYFTEEEKALCVLIYQSSFKTYKLMQSMFYMPTIKTIRDTIKRSCDFQNKVDC